MSPHIYVNTSGPATSGMVRWNSSTRNLEVLDQYGNWQANISTTISTATDVNELLAWARNEMHRRRRLEELRKQYSSLDDAMKNLEVIAALVDSGETGIKPSLIP